MDLTSPWTRSLSPEAGRISLLIIGVVLTLSKAISWVRDMPSNSLDPIDRLLKAAHRDHSSLCRIKDHLEAEEPPPSARRPARSRTLRGMTQEVQPGMIRRAAAIDARERLAKAQLSIDQYVLFSFQTIRRSNLAKVH